MKRMVVAGLQWYRSYRSLRPAACRYVPTCSTYALESVEIHGPIKGLYLATRRVLRCHPLGGHGHDPVPARDELRHNHA